MDRAHTRGNPAKRRSGNRDYGGYGRDISVVLPYQVHKGGLEGCEYADRLRLALGPYLLGRRAQVLALGDSSGLATNALKTAKTATRKLPRARSFSPAAFQNTRSFMPQRDRGDVGTQFARESRCPRPAQRQPVLRECQVSLDHADESNGCLKLVPGPRPAPPMHSRIPAHGTARSPPAPIPIYVLPPRPLSLCHVHMLKD